MADGGLTIDPKWLRYMPKGVRSLALKLFLPSTGGAASGGSVPTYPGYPVMASMSSMARFPWVYACAMAIVEDMSSVPLFAIEPTSDESGGKIITGHPLIMRMKHPAPGVTEVEFRRQYWTDYVLNGTSYTYVRNGDITEPFLRMHPAKVKALVGGLGEVTGYEWTTPNGDRKIVGTHEVVRIANPSWQDTTEAAYGASPIQALQDTLSMMLASQRHASKSAKRGRPDVVISPSSDMLLGDLSAKQIAAKFDEKLTNGDSVVVVPAPLDVTFLSTTPKELDYIEGKKLGIEEVLAAFGVPGIRIGRSDASYGSGRQAMRTYWQSRQHDAALADSAWSQMTPDTVEIESSFAKIEALQIERSERQKRAALWMDMGMTPVKAAAYEGFQSAPLPDVLMVAPKPARAPQGNADEPQDEPQDAQGRRSLADDLSAYHVELRERNDFDVVTDAERMRAYFIFAQHLGTDAASDAVAHWASMTSVALDHGNTSAWLGQIATRRFAHHMEEAA